MGMDLLGFGFIAAISLVIVGIPAALLKTLAAAFGAPNRESLILRSIFWGAVVGLVMIAIQLTANHQVVRTPAWRDAIVALGGWQWTVICFGLLTGMAVVVDYFMVVRRLQPRLPLLQVLFFLALSNVWVVEGGWLLGHFNRLTLFQSCIDPATKEFVDTFYQPPPAGCEPFSD